MSWSAPPPDSKTTDVWLSFLDDDDTKYFLLDGAVRSSKTFGSILAWCDWVENCAPKGPLIMMGHTRETLIQNVIDPMKLLLNTDGREICHLNRGTSTLTLFGRQVYLFGGSNITAVSRIQGKGAVGAYCDEAPTYPREVWDMLGTRTAAEGIKIIATMNPESPYHWMKKEYLDRLDEINGRRWHYSLDDNSFLSEKVKAELKRQYTGVFKRRFVDGEWAIADGLIYNSFTEDPNDGFVTDTLPSDLQSWVVGCDYGTENPSAWIMAGFSPSKRKWFAVKEYFYSGRDTKRAKTDDDYTNDMVKFLNWNNKPTFVRGIMVDPAEAHWIKHLRKAHRKAAKYAPIINVRGANNSVIDGISNVMSLLNTHRMVIYRPGCPILIQALLNYLWDPKKQEKGIDAPLKEGGKDYNDHSCDGFRYLCAEVERLGYC